MVDYAPVVGLATLLLNLPTLGIGYWVSRLLRLPRRQAVAIAGWPSRGTDSRQCLRRSAVIAPNITWPNATCRCHRSLGRWAAGLQRAKRIQPRLPPLVCLHATGAARTIVGGTQLSPSSLARATAWVRRSTPSLKLMRWAWVFTVCSEMNRLSAICWLE
ncbi:hypothetical protein D9M68_795270 [compost metagenome]